MGRNFLVFILIFGSFYGIKGQNQTISSDTAGINKARLATVIGTTSAFYIGGMSYLEYIWYSDVPRVPFHFYNDLKAYNQLDKFGHMYGSYLESYVCYHAYRWAGVPRNKAIWYGGLMGFFMQLPIEIWDGLYQGWGFSLGDAAANALGSALVIGQELAFREQIVKYKLSFSRSPYAPLANGYLGNGFNEFVLDYNGHTYWLSTGINRIIPVKTIPDWVNISVGYGIGGVIGSFYNKTFYNGQSIPEFERHRRFLLSLDIDFTKIPVKNKALKALFNSMFIIKLPFPAIEYNTLGQVKFHPLYY
jgi:hypothetical protein